MSFLDRLKESAMAVVQQNPLTQFVSSASRFISPERKEATQNVLRRVVDTGRRTNELLQPVRNVNPVSASTKVAADWMARPAARAIASAALSAPIIKRATGKEGSIPDSAISRGIFGMNTQGDRGGEVASIQETMRRGTAGEGASGAVGGWLEQRTGIPRGITAPALIAAGTVLDANPLSGISKKAATTGASLTAKLVNQTDGLLKNIPVGTLGDVINQADILPTVVKAGAKMDDLSTIIRTAKGKYKLIPPKQVASYLAKQTGAQVVSTLGDVSRTLGFEKAQDYAVAAAEFMKTNKIGKGFTQARARGGLTDVAANALQAKPYTPMNIAEELASNASKDPLKDAITVPFDTVDDLKKVAQIRRQLQQLNTPEADEAIQVLAQRFEQAAQGREKAQYLRLMQELYARDPNALVDEAQFVLRQINKDLKKAGKAEVSLTDVEKAKLKELEDLFRAAAPNSNDARTIISEANNLIWRKVPRGFAEKAGAWFRSSILSSTSTGVLNLTGSAAKNLIELPERPLNLTLGNAITKRVLGARGAGAFDRGAALRETADSYTSFIRDAMKGTNTFAGDIENISSGLARPQKAFYSTGKETFKGGPVQIAKNIANSVADYQSRWATIMSGSEMPAKRGVEFARIDEITRLAREAGEDISKPEIQKKIFAQAALEADTKFLSGETWLSDVFEGFRNVIARVGVKENSKAMQAVSKLASIWTLPIIRFPVNALKTGLYDYSPAGIIMSVVHLVKDAKRLKESGSALDKIIAARKFQQGFSKGVNGTAAATSVAWLGNEWNFMTFGRSESDKRANLDVAQGIPANGLNVNAFQRALKIFADTLLETGDPVAAFKAPGKQEWKPNDSVISWDYFQPIAIPIGLIGKTMELAKNNSGLSLPEKLSRSFNDTVKSVLGRPVFQNVKLVGSAAQSPEASASNYVSSVLAGMLSPGWISDLARLSDIGEDGIRQRETFSGNFGEGILNRVRNRVPILRQDLPQAVDIGGRPMSSGNLQQSAASFFFRDLAPKKIDYPVTAQVGLMLEGNTGMTEAIPSRYEKTGTAFNVPFSLSSEDLVWARETYGKVTQKKIQRLIQDQKFLAKDSVGQANAISQEYSDVKKRLDAYFVAKQFGIEGDLSWYQWGDVFDGARKIENNNGVTLMDTLSFDRKRDFLKTYIERNNITKQ